MAVELFHDQNATKDGAGTEDRTRDLRSISRTANPTDLAGPAHLFSKPLDWLAVFSDPDTF